MAREGVAFEALDNGLLSCEDPGSAQQTCDELSAEKFAQLAGKWLARLPHPYPQEDRLAGYCYGISSLQAEFSLTQILDRPLDRAGLFRAGHPRQPGPGAARPGATGLQPPSDQEDARPVPHPRPDLGRGALALHRLQHTCIQQYHKEGRGSAGFSARAESGHSAATASCRSSSAPAYSFPGRLPGSRPRSAASRVGEALMRQQPEHQQGQEQGQHSEVSAAQGPGRAGHPPSPGCEWLGSRTPAGREGQPLADGEIARVVDGGFRAMGLRAALFLSRSCNRLLRSGLSAIGPSSSACRGAFAAGTGGRRQSHRSCLEPAADRRMNQN